jgi:hypothetical protein
MRTRMPGEGEVPYHAAPVIATDGRTYVTAEADAGDLNRRNPVYDVYARGDRASYNLPSFHGTHQDTYTSDGYTRSGGKRTKTSYSPATGLFRPRG